MATDGVYRALWLAKQPLCVECYMAGIVKAANVVDHIIPHKGDRAGMTIVRGSPSLN